MKRVRQKETSGQFYDPETGLRVVKAGVVNLGSRIGRKTQYALNAGGLIVVEDGVASPMEDVARVTEEDLPPSTPDTGPEPPPPLPKAKKPPARKKTPVKKPASKAKK